MKQAPFQVIVADPPWSFGDKLTMSDVKRGAESNYATLKLADIIGLKVYDIAAPNSVLALWVPSSMLQDGLEVMKAWGFKQKTIFTWVKQTPKTGGLAFGMGHFFRAASEHCLFGERGKCKPISRSERNVRLDIATPHSQKPEALQDSLDRMYPTGRKLELFARRSRPGWVCTGNECPDTRGEDVRETIKRLAASMR